MKFKRSERLVDMTVFLLENPYKTISLNFFTERYKSAKSSISEDISILKDSFNYQELGIIRTHSGAGGGVEYIPAISMARQEEYIDDIIAILDDEDRILPGGYIYVTDIISNTSILKKVGKILASRLVDIKVDYILTSATKGIPLAQALAYEIGVPFIIARNNSKVTEGPTVSVKYTSESAPRLVQSMEITRDAIEEGSDIVLVDDFLRGGGTMRGMEGLGHIFKANIRAKYVLCENIGGGLSRDPEIQSLIKIEGLDYQKPILNVGRGSLFD